MLSLVANHRSPAAAPSGITVLDPRDGSVVGTISTANDDDIARALGQARATVTAWAAVSPADRGDALHRMAAAVLSYAEELAELNTLETGQSLDESLAGIKGAVSALRQYAELGPLHRTDRMAGARASASYAIPEPRGVVVVLTPWNDPIATAASLIGAAIVTGNVVLHKPSEHCPHLGARLGEVLSGCLPDGVLTTLTGGPGVGSVLVASRGVDVIAHVGSTRSGRRIAALAARTGAHVVRANGGNDALLVDADVDPVWAAGQAALGAFGRSGQMLSSVERIFVHAAIAEPFLAALVEQAQVVNQCELLAPLITDDARAEVHRQVVQSVQAGAVVLEGGFVPSRAGSHYPATVVTDCPVDSPLMTEETCGPVAPVHVVDDFETGLILAAIDRYGLAATVLSGSLAHINDAIATLPVGTVKINSVLGDTPGSAAQPRGDSGSGFGYGPELLNEMTTRKVVQMRLPVLRRETPDL